jgi:hypothetical protein
MSERVDNKNKRAFAERDKMLMRGDSDLFPPEGETVKTTYYYRFVRPFTSARAVVRGVHTHLSLWVNHANAGELVLRHEEAAEVLGVLREGLPSVQREEKDGEFTFYFANDDIELDTPLFTTTGEFTTLAYLGMTDEQKKEFGL